jgi:type IV pilus assembly protein PilA
MKKQSEGFTLIELMITVAIIGILALLALVSYQVYAVRAQTSEGPVLADALRNKIAEYHADKGTWPADNATLGITNTISGSYVSDVSQTNGVITIKYGNKANALSLAGEFLTIRPAVSAHGDIAWVCGYAATPGGATVVGADGTTVSQRYLPSACR